MTELMPSFAEQQTGITPEQSEYYSEYFREAGRLAMHLIEASDYTQGIDKFCDRPVDSKGAWKIGEFDGYDKLTEDPMKVGLYLVDNGHVMTVPRGGLGKASTYRPGEFGDTEADAIRLYSELVNIVDDEQFRQDHALPALPDAS